MGLASVLLVLSPFTQINTPYPSTAYLKGYLEAKGVHAGQTDLGIETILALFFRNLTCLTPFLCRTIFFCRLCSPERLTRRW